ncbi:MAG: metalloregulator ArsR/SmtB family transcription factor [Candidatus Paceibacterota bacterium]
MKISEYNTTHTTVLKPSSICRVLANESRYALLNVLLRTKEDLCVNEIAEAIGLSQSATSHQLAQLEILGLVRSVRMGKTKCYMMTDTPATKKIARIIQSLE